MKKLKVLMADNKRNGNYKALLKSWFSKLGFDADITMCKSDRDIKNYKEERYDISFLDWNFHDKATEINSSKICIMSGNDSIDGPRFASLNQYSFVYKPFNYKKFNDIIKTHC